MQKYFFLAAALCCFTICSAQKDDKKKNPQPETMNQLYYVGDSSKLIVVKEELAAMKTKTKLAGFAGASTAYVMDGESSSVHISNGHPSFAIKLATMNGMMTDPTQMIRLFKFEAKDKTRESILSKSGVMGKGASNNMDGIKLTFKESGDGVYILAPAESLESGEYGFVNMAMPKDVSNRKSIKYAAFPFAIGK